MHSLDILRGFALLGMILVHVHTNLERPATGLEDLISWTIWVGVEQKSWATFAFLFGVGFALQLRRMEAKGAAVTPLYLRRLLGLSLFGIPAYALFGFRILLDYAFWGVPLLFMRRWSTRSLLVAALVCMSALSLVETAKGAHEWFTLGRQGADAAAEARSASPNPTWTALKTAQAQPSYSGLLGARLRAMRADYLRWSFLVPGANLALFILGFLALRRGVFDSPKKHTRMILAFMAVGIISWAVSWLFLRNLNTDFIPQRIAAQFRNGFGILSEQWLAFAYIGGIVLLLAYRPVWERRLAAFGMAGRMALTNYLIQIAVLDLLSSGYGLGLRVRPAMVPLLAALIFGAEVGLTRLWLAHHRLGPAEWLWRSFTYGKPQPMRR
ncbi:MAG TPA: DUF418 domain-containing protein [Gemmatimonadales bacterium]|nr:DUF418 domain-containing protein [Gemmatimonadales bacterium]